MDYHTITDLEVTGVTATYGKEFQDRREEGIIPLLMGGEMVINYLKPEQEESPWDDNDYNGPQAA